MLHVRTSWLGILIFLAAAALPAYSQGGRERSSVQVGDIRGQVRYLEGGAAAEFVLVRLELFGGGVVGEERTDRTGKFRFAGLKPDKYRVTVVAAGYRKEEREVDLETFSTDYVQFQLTREADSKDAVPAAGSGTVVDARVPAEAKEEFEKGKKALLDESNREQGIAHLERAVKIFPDFVQAQLLLGTSYLDSQQKDKAEKALQHAVRLDPNSSPALIALGEVKRQKGERDEAEKLILEGLKRDDSAWQGHFALGRLYWDKGDILKAGPEVGRTIQLNPNFAEADLLAGNILLRARQPENALGMFEEYLRKEPNGPFAQQTRDIVQKIKKALAESKKP